MNDPVRVDKASLDALTESLRAQSVTIAELKTSLADRDAEIARLRSIVIQHGLGSADEATEPEDANGVEQGIA